MWIADRDGWPIERTRPHALHPLNLLRLLIHGRSIRRGTWKEELVRKHARVAKAIGFEP